MHLSLSLSLTRAGVPRPVAPPGYVLLADDDGVLLQDANGVYLMEAI